MGLQLLFPIEKRVKGAAERSASTAILKLSLEVMLDCTKIAFRIPGVCELKFVLAVNMGISVCLSLLISTLCSQWKTSLRNNC